MIARVLTIAGSDSSGGAGVQQDLRTFTALGVWGMTAITAITVQSTTGVWRIVATEPDVVAAQILAVAEDIGVDAAKTGMLATEANVIAVARALDEAGIDRLVVDPVLRASTGDSLASEGVLSAIRSLLVPRATVVTPNASEASALSGIDVVDRASQARAASAIRTLGAEAVLVTGGHLEGEAVDVLAHAAGITEFAAPRIDTPNTHGTGCVLSAAIAAGLARGLTVEDAVRRAKEVVTESITGALALGKGAGPVLPGGRS